MNNRRIITLHPKRASFIAILLLSAFVAFLISNLMGLSYWLDMTTLSLSIWLPISVLLLIIQSVIKPGASYIKLFKDRRKPNISKKDLLDKKE